MLSDWVRGRIPFFVPPPERPEELNKAEAKAAKKDSKGKAKAHDEEQERVPGVTQNFGSIMQKNSFVAEDIRPLDDEGEGSADQDAQSDAGESGDDDAEGEVDDGEEFEEDLAWNDVFKGDDPAEGVTTVFSKADDEAEQTSDVESEATGKKDPRMKTNKVC